MPVSKPTNPIRWADVSGTITEPASGKKDTGYIANDVPGSGELNWFFNGAYKWFIYLDDLVNQALTWTAKHIFNGDVDLNGTTTVNGAAVFPLAGSVDFQGDVDCTGAGSTVSVAGTTSLAGTCTIGGLATLNNGASIPTGKQLELLGTTEVKITSNPTYNSATTNIFNNKVHAKNVNKSWADITLNHTSGANVDNGFNVDTVLIGYVGSDFHLVTVFFKQAMADANYSIAYEDTSPGGSTASYRACTYTKGTGSFTFKIQVIDNGGSISFGDMSVIDVLTSFTVHGTM